MAIKAVPVGVVRVTPTDKGHTVVVDVNMVDDAGAILGAVEVEFVVPAGANAAAIRDAYRASMTTARAAYRSERAVMLAVEAALNVERS